MRLLDGSCRLLACGLGFASVVALAHCGNDGGVGARIDAASDASEEEPYVAAAGSGTRFRVIRIDMTYSDGATTTSEDGFLFYDNKKKLLCSIREVAPGEFRCLPDLTSALEEGFSDPTCTTAVVSLESYDEMFPPAYVASGPGCALRLGKILAPKRGSLFRKNATTGACEVARSNVWTTPTADAPLAQFGTFTRAPAVLPGIKSGTRISVTVDRVTGDDGSFRLLDPRLADATLKSAVVAGRAADAKGRLLPAASAIRDFSYFSDDACTTKTTQFERPSGSRCEVLGPPFLGGTKSERREGCGLQRVFARPTTAPIATVYQSSGTACMPAPSYLAYDFYPAAALVEVPAASMAEVATKLVATTAGATAGKLVEPRRRVTSTADGLELRDLAVTMVLSKYDVPCVLKDFVGERCVPDAPSIGERGTYFADAACSKGVVPVYNPAKCDGRTTQFYGGFLTSSYAIYKPIAGSAAPLTTAFRRDMMGACIVADADGYSEYLDPASLELVDAKEFPTIKRNITIE